LFGFYESHSEQVHFFLVPLFCQAFATCGILLQSWIAANFRPKAGLFLMHSMKAMTWLKISGGVLVALAAIAAADTRYAEVTGKGPMQGIGHAIASGRDSCPIAIQQEQVKIGCCNAYAQHQQKKGSAGCCRK
jgi:hypothetical protein